MKHVRNMISVFFKYNNLLRELVVRDIKVRYRRSVLGILWTLLFPLSTMLVMVVVFSTLFKMAIPRYPVYFLSGSILFSFTTEATNQAAMSIVSNFSLLKKVYIPKYLFPLSRVLSSLVNLGFAFVALLIVMLATGAPFKPTLPLIVIPIGYMILFVAGLSLLLSAMTVFFRDITSLYSVLSMLWLYLTPVFYPISIIPEKFRLIYKWNPMYYYIGYFRSLILDGEFPDFKTNLICLFCGVVSLIMGLIVFRRTQDRFMLHI